MELRPIGSVAAIYRCVVKSTTGELMPAAEIEFPGLAHNRSWVVFDSKKHQVVTGKANAGVPLLSVRSWRSSGGLDWLQIPGDEPRLCRSPEAAQRLSDYLNYRVQLLQVATVPNGLSTNFNFALRRGTGVDSSPVHLVTTSSLGAVGLSLHDGVVRFRPTFVIDTGGEQGFLEDGWNGCRLVIGDRVQLVDRKPTERCPLPARPSGNLPAMPELLGRMRRLLPGTNKPEMWLGRYGVVLEPGSIRVGDPVSVVV